MSILSLKSINQVKIGAMLSYVLIIINALFGLLVTPFILQSLGASEYGVYKTVASFANALMVLDLGLGGTVMRYVAKYTTNNEKDKISSFISMAFCEAFVLIVIVIVATVGIYINLSSIFGSSFTAVELQLAQRLFVVLGINLVAHIVENIFNGILTGFNDFVIANGIKLVRVLLRILLVFVLLTSMHSALVLVVIDLGLTVATILVELYISLRKYKVDLSVSIHNWDQAVFRESFAYTGLLFLTSIAAQVNGNLDNTVIGAILGPSYVTIYSFGLLIFGMYEELSTSISGVMLPTVTRIIKEDPSGNQLQFLIIRAGRIQFLLLGAALTGFVILGQDFIFLWLGEGFEDVYAITLILMIPSLLELCVNVCLTVLRAKNMLLFRTITLIITTVLNFFITVVGLKVFSSYYAAAIGTAASFAIGSVIVMNTYYYKKLHLHMLQIYSAIAKGIWGCLFIAGVATFIFSKVCSGSWLMFILNVAVFVTTYGLSLLLFGMDKAELDNIPIINRFTKKKENKHD